MGTPARECQNVNNDGSCPAPERERTAEELFNSVYGFKTEPAARASDEGQDPYNFHGDTELEIPPVGDDSYSYYGQTDTDGAPATDSSAKDAALQKLGALDQSGTLQRGMVLYDIARDALVARSNITGEGTDHDSIMRECNRMMVLNGYPDANLEGKSHITMADLPREWNGVRWDQEFKLYDEAALKQFSELAVQNGKPQAEPEQPPKGEGEQPPQGEGEQPPAPQANKASLDDANSFFICQFRDQRFNPNGPSSSNDCGPASLAMIARYYGAQLDDPKYGHINAGDANPAELVSSVRYLMTGGRDEQKLTGLGQIKKAAGDMGLKTAPVQSMADLNQALDSGVMVVLAGNPKDYQKDLGLHYGKGGTVYDGGHFVTVVGRDGDNYIVNDPASHGGALTLTKDQVANYMNHARPENRGAAIWAEESKPAEVEPPPAPASASDNQKHATTTDGFQANLHPDLNLDLRGFNPISGLPHYTSDGGDTDQNAPQLASLFGKEHAVNNEQLPAVKQLYRVNDWNWDESIPKSQSKGRRGQPITSTEVTMLGFESKAGEPIYLPNSGYRVDQKGHQGQVLYMDRAKGEITVAYNLSGTVAGGYTVHIRGANLDAGLQEGGLVGSDAPLGTARGNELLVAITDRGTFMDARLQNHWWQRRNRHGQ